MTSAQYKDLNVNVTGVQKTFLSYGADTAGRACICNALMATAGLPQVRAGRHVEPPIVTIGDDLPSVRQFQSGPDALFTAADVVAMLSKPLGVS